MLAVLTAQNPVLKTPVFDWHALAPEIILVVTIAAVLIADLVLPDREAGRRRGSLPSVCSRPGPGGNVGVQRPRHARCSAAPTWSTLLDRLDGLLPRRDYVTILLSVDYISEGDYYKGEYYVLLLTSTFGMVVMASARDLVTLFVALETISIPTFILAASASTTGGRTKRA